MRPLNEQYFGSRRPTDVISFRYPPLPGEAPAHWGEVLVNVEQARREGTRRGGIGRELSLYIAHGCQHLTGADDATSAQRARMRRVENRWLREAGRLNLLAFVQARKARAPRRDRA